MKNINFILLIFLFFSCGNKKEAENTTTEQPANVIELSTAQLANASIENALPEKRMISSVLRVSGKIDVPPQNIVSVSMPLGGYLKSTDLLPGMKIKKGQVLATMEDKEYIRLQEEYLQAKVKLKTAEAEYKRQKELSSSNATSEKVFQQAEADYNSVLILKNSLAEKLKLIHVDPSRINESNISGTVNVYSSIDGYVSSVNVNIGKYVTPAEVLFELINPTDIHLNLKVFEKDLASVAIGQKVMAWTNQQDKKYSGEVILVGQNLDADRSAEVHCHFDNYDKTLFPGMYMNAEIETGSQSVWAVPDEAIVLFEGKEYVFISLGNNKYQFAGIKIGGSENGFTEIRFQDKRDPANTRIVIKGAYTLLMQLKNSGEEE